MSRCTGCLEAHRRSKERESQYYDTVEGKSYLINRKIGAGEFSEVFEASRCNASQQTERYAMKVKKEVQGVQDSQKLENSKST